MSTQAITGSNTPLTVADSDTYISTSATQPVVAVLPEVDDGSSDTVAVGTEIRFEATGGGDISVITFDGRLVVRVPGRGQAVVVAQSGAQESEIDSWAVAVLPQSPASSITAASESHSSFSDADADLLGVAINALIDVLVDAGYVKAE